MATALPPAAQQAFAALMQGNRPESYPLGQLAEMVQGTVIGDGTLPVVTVAHPKYVTDPRSLVVILDEKIVPLLQQFVQMMGQPVPCALVAENIDIPEGLVVGQLKHPRPRLALGILLKLFHQPTAHASGIHPTAIIDPLATVADSANIGPYAVIGANTTIGERSTVLSNVNIGANVTLGDDNFIHPGVVIGDNCQLGDRVILQPNVVIGGDGFSYVTPEAGSIESAKQSGGTDMAKKNTEILKIESIGNVILEDDVEIGSGSTIDRANLGPTLIGKGTKIDNLVQVGHNNTIGENCLIAALAGISGSCEIGDRVVMGGQCGIKDHTKIGHDTILMARSAVMNDIEPEKIMAGVPAEGHRDAFKHAAGIRQIPDMRKTLRELTKRLDALEKANN